MFWGGGSWWSRSELFVYWGGGSWWSRSELFVGCRFLNISKAISQPLKLFSNSWHCVLYNDSCGGVKEGSPLRLDIVVMKYLCEILYGPSMGMGDKIPYGYMELLHSPWKVCMKVNEVSWTGGESHLGFVYYVVHYFEYYWYYLLFTKYIFYLSGTTEFPTRKETLIFIEIEISNYRYCIVKKIVLLKIKK